MNKLVLSTAEPIEEIAYRLKAMLSGIKHNINLIDKEKFSISHIEGIIVQMLNL